MGNIPLKKYDALDLREIREKYSLDFAHFTYQKHQCSCCYGPRDLPKLYWKDRTIKEEGRFTYILFKNAHNGSGSVTKNDYIQDYTCVEYNIPDTSVLQGVVMDLQRQLGPSYLVQMPTDPTKCIVIRLAIKSEETD